MRGAVEGNDLWEGHKEKKQKQEGCGESDCGDARGTRADLREDLPLNVSKRRGTTLGMFRERGQIIAVPIIRKGKVSAPGAGVLEGLGRHH